MGVSPGPGEDAAGAAGPTGVGGSTRPKMLEVVLVAVWERAAKRCELSVAVPDSERRNSTRRETLIAGSTLGSLEDFHLSGRPSLYAQQLDFRTCNKLGQIEQGTP
jgi:hypothetical protein